jgi:hypothetical protein
MNISISFKQAADEIRTDKPASARNERFDFIQIATHVGVTPVELPLLLAESVVAKAGLERPYVQSKLFNQLVPEFKSLRKMEPGIQKQDRQLGHMRRDKMQQRHTLRLEGRRGRGLVPKFLPHPLQDLRFWSSL